MNLYLSKKIIKIQFFGNTVSFSLAYPVVKVNRGLAFVVFCICNGINEIEKIAYELSDTFNLNNTVDEIKKIILNNTIEDESIKNAFTFDIEKANLSPKVYGAVNKRYPEILHIEITGSCNFECSHCYKNAVYNGKYIDIDWLKEKIDERFNGFISAIHLTGGEPMLHKDFSKIVDLFSNGYNLQLTTNGSRIFSYPLELFKKFEAIDISLYGLNDSEYLLNTGTKAFEQVTVGCKLLSKANIDFRVTLVINNDNWRQMEDYVQYAINVGAKRIGFALPTNGGKLLLNTPDKWYISGDTKKKIYREFRALQKKYENNIAFSEWHRTKYSDMWKSYPPNDSLRCGAGTKEWWISEKYTFRPCSFLPEQYINMDYDQWYSYINGDEEVNWSKARKALELFASQNNREITDFCSIFQR